MSHVLSTLDIDGKLFHILVETESEGYLGRTLCFYGCHVVEFKRRISAGWANFRCFKNELIGKDYSLQSRLRLFEAVITTTVLFGSCTWATTKETLSALDVARRKMLRYVLRIFRHNGGCEEWSDYLARVARSVEHCDFAYKLVPWSCQAKARKWKFAGELARCTDGRWTKLILDWKPAWGYRRVGRPCVRWSDSLVRYAGGNWAELALEPDTWETHCSGFINFDEMS